MDRISPNTPIFLLNWRYVMETIFIHSIVKKPNNLKVTSFQSIALHSITSIQFHFILLTINKSKHYLNIHVYLVGLVIQDTMGFRFSSIS